MEIKERYCSFEVSKLLQDKGFDESVLGYYNILDGKINPPVWDVNTYRSSEAQHLYIKAPTHQMAMAWLREVHNIDIDIDAEVGMLGIKVYLPIISTYKSVTYNPGKLRQYKRGLYYKDDKGVIPCLQDYDSYEEAVEAALLYCLTNLI